MYPHPQLRPTVVPQTLPQVSSTDFSRGLGAQGPSPPSVPSASFTGHSSSCPFIHMTKELFYHECNMRICKYKHGCIHVPMCMKTPPDGWSNSPQWVSSASPPAPTTPICGPVPI